jgi:hypothetical protein
MKSNVYTHYRCSDGTCPPHGQGWQTLLDYPQDPDLCGPFVRGNPKFGHITSY